MQNMMTIVMVSDMDRSIQFYEQALGLKLKFRSPDWSEFAVGSTTLGLHGGAKPTTPSPWKGPDRGYLQYWVHRGESGQHIQ